MSNTTTTRTKYKGGDKYEYTFETQKAYVTRNGVWGDYVYIFGIIALVGMLAYDWVRDKLRVLSGYNDILHGQGIEGMKKVYGLTSGNARRGMIIFGMIIGLLLISKYINAQKKEISLEQVPEDIRNDLITRLKFVELE